jgi:hypothetical protein
MYKKYTTLEKSSEFTVYPCTAKIRKLLNLFEIIPERAANKQEVEFTADK